MSDSYFHIGMPKAASSYLQKNFFPLLNLNYMGKHYLSAVDQPKKHFEFEKIFKEIFIRQPQNITNSFCDELLRHISSEKKYEKTLYSNEGLFGSYYESFRNGFSIIHNLQRIFQHPKIILVLRRQDTFLESLYRQAIRNGYWKSIHHFIGCERNTFRRYKISATERIDLINLKYDEYLSFCCSLLGQENILVLPYEAFCHEKEAFLKDICGFLETQLPETLSENFENKSDSVLYLNILRILNFISHKTNIRPPLWINTLLGYHACQKTYISPSLRSKIIDFFGESNQHLAEKYNLNSLNKYNYF